MSLSTPSPSLRAITPTSSTPIRTHLAHGVPHHNDDVVLVRCGQSSQGCSCEPIACEPISAGSPSITFESADHDDHPHQDRPHDHEPFPHHVLAERFVLGERAEVGGMSEIYRAWDLARGQDVAVKLLRDRHASDEVRSRQQARFQREVRLIEELDHPRIVRYVAHGVLPSGAPYLVLEWLDGEDLSHTLARGRLGVDESLQIARGVAEALAAAHARGVVHRDLKPSNVFLEQASPRQVKLLDFGIAWLSAEARSLDQRIDI